MSETDLERVERACVERADADQPVTFTAVAARARIARATLYRRTELRAIVEEHRARGQDARTLSGLAAEVDGLRDASRPSPPRSAVTTRHSATSPLPGPAAARRADVAASSSSSTSPTTGLAG